jgi:hypothetical protein
MFTSCCYFYHLGDFAPDFVLFCSGFSSTWTLAAPSAAAMPSQLSTFLCTAGPSNLFDCETLPGLITLDDVIIWLRDLAVRTLAACCTRILTRAFRNLQNASPDFRYDRSFIAFGYIKYSHDKWDILRPHSRITLQCESHIITVHSPFQSLFSATALRASLCPAVPLIWSPAVTVTLTRSQAASSLHARNHSFRSCNHLSLIFAIISAFCMDKQ